MTSRDYDLVSLFPASRVEVFIGSSRSGRSPVVANAAFKRLGYIAFSSNQQNGYRVSQPCYPWFRGGGGGDCSRCPILQSRELKSIPLDVSCQFVKLVFYENHVNYLNVFNQVGVVRPLDGCVTLVHCVCVYYIKIRIIIIRTYVCLWCRTNCT